jgi:hypothetical protein
MSDVLSEIQRTQFTDRARAEQMLLEFMRKTLALDVATVELRPLAVSLNSFNGFLTLADGKRLFFKTHTEPDSVIGEYYNAASLAEAGYPVIQPVYASTEAGRQLLVYEVVEDPSVFDVAWQIENGDATLLDDLTAAQHESDRQLAEIYVATLRNDDPARATAAVHQLFYHRLTGPRYQQFYGDTTTVKLPMGTLSVNELMGLRWRINGQEYATSLGELVTRSIELLTPSPSGPSIVGHGDAHNGNVFLQSQPYRLVYFDPAFAGRHDPLLDLTKPLFHNVFAMWMYFPDEMHRRLTISGRLESGTIVVEHDHRLIPVRRMFFESKVRHTLTPVVVELARRGWLSDRWREQLKASLLCCPLLTMNLTDAERFPPEISLLGLAYAVEMGGESLGVRSVIDQALDEVAAAL